MSARDDYGKIAKSDAVVILAVCYDEYNECSSDRPFIHATSLLIYR